MFTTKKPGDVLIGVGEAVGGAFVFWLLQMYGLLSLGVVLGVILIWWLISRYVIPRVSQRVARISSSYRRKRFEVWTKVLKQYEANLADGRRYTARLI
jgi:hypothetical protein